MRRATGIRYGDQRKVRFLLLLKPSASTLILASLALVPAAWAQSGLKATNATNKRVDLSWTAGTPTSYTVQRRALGASFSNIATAVTGATYSDTTIDAFTTYQYQVVASGGITPSNQITVGPPPAGFSIVAAAPPNAFPSSYGSNISMMLDGNGDPAFVFVWYDPNQDGNPPDSQLLFRSWNRVNYGWNPVVQIDAGGEDTDSSSRTTSLAYDSSTNTFAAAAVFNTGSGIKLWVSANGGTTWTLKNTFTATNGIYGPSLALANGNIYLAYVVDSVGLKYVTGQLSAAASSWPVKAPSVPTGSGPAYASAAPSLALDSTGIPAIAYWVPDGTQTYNEILMYWRPSGTAPLVKVMDTQNNQSNVAVALRFSGQNPRIAVDAVRNDFNATGSEVHFMRSDNGGTSWLAPVTIPPDHGSSASWPLDLAIDSQNRGAIVFGRNSGNGTDLCGNPKLSRSNDLTAWTTCAPADPSITGNYDVFPDTFALAFGGNDKLYLLWHQSGDNGTGIGVLMWREPPASAVSGPVISQGGIVAHSSAQKNIVGGSWVDIYGTNFTDVSTTWSNADFSNGLPTTLGGVQVLMNNQPAAVAYVSPTQLVVQAPAAANAGASGLNVNVQVVHNGVPGNTATVGALAHEPSIFTYPGGTNVYPATLLGDGATLGDPAVVPGTRKAHPGEAVTLWVTGLGVSPAGVAVNSPIPYSDTVTIPGLVGSDGKAVTASFAGLVAPGLFQVNFIVPTTVTSNRTIQVQVTGGGSQAVVLPVGN
jgi:uncharacterized protein (TIGR03437 family)